MFDSVLNTPLLTAFFSFFGWNVLNLIIQGDRERVKFKIFEW